MIMIAGLATQSIVQKRVSSLLYERLPIQLPDFYHQENAIRIHFLQSDRDQ